MIHIDYTWDLDSNGIKFDEELNLDRLGWHDGDVFKVETINGRRYMKKVDPLIAFVFSSDKETKNEV
jgi:hypothetical protein